MPEVVDRFGKAIKVGGRVRAGDEDIDPDTGEIMLATVAAITGFDADVDEEGRTYGINPDVVVVFDDDEEREVRFATSFPEGYTPSFADEEEDEPVMVCEDLDAVDF